MLFLHYYFNVIYHIKFYEFSKDKSNFALYLFVFLCTFVLISCEKIYLMKYIDKYINLCVCVYKLIVLGNVILKLVRRSEIFIDNNIRIDY